MKNFIALALIFIMAGSYYYVEKIYAPSTYGDSIEIFKEAVVTPSSEYEGVDIIEIQGIAAYAEAANTNTHAGVVGVITLLSGNILAEVPDLYQAVHSFNNMITKARSGGQMSFEDAQKAEGLNDATQYSVTLTSESKVIKNAFNKIKTGNEVKVTGVLLKRSSDNQALLVAISKLQIDKNVYAADE